MTLAEIFDSVEDRRIAILKNNADRAKREFKDAKARAKIKKGQETLRQSQKGGRNDYSLMGR